MEFCALPAIMDTSVARLPLRYRRPVSSTDLIYYRLWFLSIALAFLLLPIVISDDVPSAVEEEEDTWNYFGNDDDEVTFDPNYLETRTKYFDEISKGKEAVKKHMEVFYTKFTFIFYFWCLLLLLLFLGLLFFSFASFGPPVLQHLLHCLWLSIFPPADTIWSRWRVATPFYQHFVLLVCIFDFSYFLETSKCFPLFISINLDAYARSGFLCIVPCLFFVCRPLPIDSFRSVRFCMLRIQAAVELSPYLGGGRSRRFGSCRADYFAFAATFSKLSEVDLSLRRNS
eukprot:GHVT01093216.1.p1 GENE.GHVT01093216.1~~GHVT01093216.1.p1  ORF type:complete len:285 (+),score=10.05 GHVT01093216.1:669-1523(+)